MRLKFNILPPGREKVTAGYTYDKGMRAGRPHSPGTYESQLISLTQSPDISQWNIAIYPGNYRLACLDMDMSPERSQIVTDYYPPLFHTQSRSYYNSDKMTMGGHNWYRAPSKSEHLTGYHRLRETRLNGEEMQIDILLTQLCFIPAPQFEQWLRGCLHWWSIPPEEQRSRYSFPYSVKLLAARKGNRDSTFFQSLSQQAFHTTEENIDRTLWHRVLTDIGYFEDHAETEFTRQFDNATSRSSDDPTEIVRPFTSQGLESILEDLDWEWRYNARTTHPEYSRSTDTRFHSLASKESRLDFIDSLRTDYQMPKGKGQTSWEPMTNWTLVENWTTTYARRQNRFDPLGQHLLRWKETEPLGEEDSLILSLMDPGPSNQPDTLRRCIVNVEKHMLLTMYTRIVTSQHDGVPEHIHFPYLPTFVGPQGAGKSRFCYSLAHGFHTNSITFDDPPKVFGETAQTKVVIELEELSEQLGRRNTNTRGLAKKYIAQTKFDYRAAYEPGATSSTYHLSGILIGTTNRPITVSPSDGLYRRIIHLPVQARSDLGDNLSRWSDIAPGLIDRALARAARHYEAGIVPRIKEDLVIRWLHEYFSQWQISDEVVGWVSTDNDEFNNDF